MSPGFSAPLDFCTTSAVASPTVPRMDRAKFGDGPMTDLPGTLTAPGIAATAAVWVVSSGSSERTVMSGTKALAPAEVTDLA
jgi:hypothetical protein